MGEHGDWAYETGKYVITGTAGKIEEDGKYLVIWKRIDGEWKISREIWNSADLAKKK